MFNLYILFPPIRQKWVKQLTENEPQHNQNASGRAARQLMNHHNFGEEPLSVCKFH